MTDSILTRQSVRKFAAQSVSKPEITQLVAAFEAAPCGMHQTDVMQAVVVTQKDLLAKVEKASGNACYDAPLLFVISTKKGSAFGERDASAAAENIMVEANSLDLGSVYVMSGALKLNKDAALKKELGIDEGYDSEVIVCLGYPAKATQPVDRSQRYKVVIK